MEEGKHMQQFACDSNTSVGACYSGSQTTPLGEDVIKIMGIQ